MMDKTQNRLYPMRPLMQRPQRIRRLRFMTAFRIEVTLVGTEKLIEVQREALARQGYRRIHGNGYRLPGMELMRPKHRTTFVESEQMPREVDVADGKAEAEASRQKLRRRP